MKIKIVQYLVGNNEKYIKLAHEVEAINKRYAELYGYTYSFDYFDDTAVIESYGGINNRERSAYKDKYIYDKLMQNDCDILVFIDTDAAISKPTIKIEDLIDEEHELFLSRGNDIYFQRREICNLSNELNRIFSVRNRLNTEFWSDILAKENKNNIYGSAEFLSICCYFHNSGFYIVKNTDRMKEFFNTVYNTELLLLDTIYFYPVCVEERAMSLCLLKKKYNALFTYVYPQAQGCLYGFNNYNYNEDMTFILHEYGTATTRQQKLDEVKSLWNNKWWRIIK